MSMLHNPWVWNITQEYETLPMGVRDITQEYESITLEYETLARSNVRYIIHEYESSPRSMRHYPGVRDISQELAGVWDISQE